MNDTRQSDPLRDLSAELAELLATEDGARTARLLQLTAAPGPRSPGIDKTATGEHAAPTPISIWRPEDRDGELYFVRPPALPLGDHYAARREIPATKSSTTLRIAYFGESAAAGYLYAPHLTPAGVLEKTLGPSGGKTCEVIDLARTNETLGGLTATVASSLQLDPDLLVIFTGNNWTLLETPEVSPYVPSLSSRQQFALAARRDPRGPAALAWRRLRNKARAALAEIARVADGRPVLLVVPEVNLADWEERQPIPWLPGDHTQRWYELYRRAHAALADGRFADVRETARTMIELDDGLSPTTHLLRAKALAGDGELAAARDAYEEHVERSSYSGLAFLGSPRASRAVQDLLRQACASHGFACVDLPRVFTKHGDSPLPGRRFFLDYCHLTLKGIEVAMKAVAAEIHEQLGAGSPTAARLPSTPGVEATACLGAAVHGSHRLLTVSDKTDWLEHWLRRALDKDPTILETFGDLATARCAPCPEVLTPQQREILSSEAPVSLQHGWRWDHLDAELLEALARVLPDTEKLAQQLLTWHGSWDRPRDLTRPPYLWEPLERFFPEAMGFDERAFHRSPWPESSFCLVADGSDDLDLDVTLRLPAFPGNEATRSGDAELLIDDRRISVLPVNENWSRHRVEIPSETLDTKDRRLPLSRLTIRWPALSDVGDMTRAEAIRRLEHGIEADFHPIFGEVFSLLVGSRGGSDHSGPE